MQASEVTLTYLLDTYKTKTGIAQRFGINRKSVENWFWRREVPKNRREQYVNPCVVTECQWCGNPIAPRSNTMYCNRSCRGKAERERLYQSQLATSGYGEKAFDAWVASCWNGSEVRGHAISA